MKLNFRERGNDKVMKVLLALKSNVIPANAGIQEEVDTGSMNP